MHSEFTAVFEKDGEWYLGNSQEIPGADGQGLRLDGRSKILPEAISLNLEYLREDARFGIPSDTRRETITIT